MHCTSSDVIVVEKALDLLTTMYARNHRWESRETLADICAKLGWVRRTV